MSQAALPQPSDSRLRLDWQAPGVALLTLDHVERRNALDMTMVEALGALCPRLERVSELRCLLVTGAGETAFCSGGDIEAWSQLSPEDFGRFWLREGNRAFEALAQLRQPVIAVLQGHCLGGGLELAACADYRIAERHIKLGQPEPGLGIVAGWSGTQRLTRRFGSQVVRRMLLMGEILSADQAQELGLVDRLADKGEGLAAALRLAKTIAARSPRANEIGKMMINAAEGEESGRVLDALAGSTAAASIELAEGLAAFRDKRQPDF